jgi:hypothetical protein
MYVMAFTFGQSYAIDTFDPAGNRARASFLNIRQRQ